ncbi:MAG: hypothetical protein AAF456_07225 [Planctomycetota bacterium]
MEDYPLNDHSTFGRDLASSLLSQQIWCWGRDIESCYGNLLKRYGFLRFEKPAGSRATSIYRLELTDSIRIILRGFGIFYGDDRRGGLFLPRFEFKPELMPASDLKEHFWFPADLPPLRLPRAEEAGACKEMLLGLVDWIGRYEAWIADGFGTTYRLDTLLDWNPEGAAVFPGDQLVGTWRRIRDEICEEPQLYVTAQG